MKKIQAISLALGFILLAYLIYSLGPAQILYSIRLIGVNFTILLLVSGLRQLLRTAAWRECFEPGQSPGLLELFNVRLAGEAIRYLSFTGPFLGEPAKAALIRKNLPLSKGLSSVIVENLTYTLGAVVITVFGVAILLANITLNRYLSLAAVAISISSISVIALVWRGIARRRSILAASLRQIHRWTGKIWFGDKAAGARKVEENVFDFYGSRKKAFLLVFVMELGVHLITVFEIYLILYFMGVDPTVLAAFMIEGVTKLINFAFFFVPAQVGVSEGGNELLLRALGFAVTTGIALALVEKIRALAWAAYGLGALTLLLRRNARHARTAVSADVSPQADLGR